MSSETELTPEQAAFKAEALALLNNRDKAPIDQRPPVGTARGPVPLMSGIRERVDTPLDLNPDGVSDKSFPNLLESHRDLVRLGLRGVFDTENTVHELQADRTLKGEEIVAKALPAAERAVRQLDNAVVKLTEVAAHYDGEVAKAVQPPLNPQEAAELRAFVREQKDPLMFVTGNILRGDNKLSAAVLSGAPYLSGLSDEHMETVRVAASERFAGEAYRARQDALKGVAKLANAKESFEGELMPRLHRWKAKADEKAKLDKAFANG